jgi:hypothetical protein
MLPSALGFDQNQNNSLRFIAGYAGNNRVDTVSNLLLLASKNVRCLTALAPAPTPTLFRHEETLTWTLLRHTTFHKSVETHFSTEDTH